ncbi:MAG: DUF1028 domain-containing protein [Planctomycetota bacterium]
MTTPFSFRTRSFLRRRFLASALAPILTLALAASQALATWSIIIVNTVTGEVAIGQATCLANFNLEVGSAVVVVGKGAACAQSFIDTTGQNRLLIFNSFQGEVPLPTILAQLAAQDGGHQSRQYGMVALYGGGDSLTFTGTGCGAYANGVTGQIGDIKYAIQGNVLTGAPVISSAEQAVLTTNGDVGQKLLAAMKAAAKKGGDGRCSCSQSAPTSCGSPPPTFTKSAHTGYMLIARIGDTNGVCNTSVGCASGTYYMNLNAIGGVSSPDPVTTLNTMYNGWRAGWVGHGDHVLSTKTFNVAGLPADGASQATLTLTLKDINNGVIAHGGASIVVTHDATSAGSCTIGPASSQGNGVYTVPLTAGSVKGVDVFKVVINDGKGNVTLYPNPKLPISALCNNYGAGTPGTLGIIPTIACNGASVVGNANFGFSLQQAPPLASVVAFAAQNSASIPFGTTGTLLFDPLSIAWESTLLSADASGNAMISAALPNDPLLSGLHAFVQVLVLDSGAEIGVSATAGLDVELL